MKCEERIDIFCREKIASNKVYSNKVCDKCCLGCIDFNKCEQRCSRLETLLYISLEG